MKAETLLCIAHGGPSPPEARPSWLMRMVEGGIVSWLVRVVRKVDMILSMSDVRGPFHSSHLGLGSLKGRLWRMSDARRCGSFCMRHWENRRSWVCSSEHIYHQRLQPRVQAIPKL